MSESTFGLGCASLWSLVRDQYFYLRLVATAVYESLKQGLRPIADLDKGGSEWLVLIIVLHWFIVLKLLQALQAGAHVLLIILPLGLLWWTLWHVFAERSHFGYFWRWPYWDFEDEEYYALDEEAIDNLVSLDPRETYRRPVRDYALGDHEWKTYSHPRPRFPLVQAQEAEMAENDPYRELEDDYHHHYGVVNEVLGANWCAEDELREEVWGAITWGQAPGDPTPPYPMSDAYTWRSGTSFTSVATPLPPIDILRDEDDDLVNYEDHLEWAEGMDLERLGSFEGEVFGQGDTAELEAGTWNVDHDVEHRFIPLYPLGTHRPRAPRHKRWYSI